MEIVAIVLWIIAGSITFGSFVASYDIEDFVIPTLFGALPLSLTGWGLYAGGIWAIVGLAPWTIAVSVAAFLGLFYLIRGYVPFTRGFVSRGMRTKDYSEASLAILKTARELPADFYPTDLEGVLYALDQKYLNKSGGNEYGLIEREVNGLINAHQEQREALRLAGISPQADMVDSLVERMRNDRQLLTEVTKELT